MVTAVRPVLFGFREAMTQSELGIDVRLRPPVIDVQSQFHYINHGGSELVVYRVTPADSFSGVRVGERTYPGFPAAGAGVESTDPRLHVAFYALSWDQALNTPVSIFARDPLGNESSAIFGQRVFPKQFRESRINLNDRFSLSSSRPSCKTRPDFLVDDPTDVLASFISINSDMRRDNHEYIASLSVETVPEMLWRGSFKQRINTAVESGFGRSA